MTLTSAPLYASRRNTRVATIVRLVEGVLRDAAADDGGACSAQPVPVAAVEADWSHSAPVLAALTAYAHAYDGCQGEASLVCALPSSPQDVDHTALAVLLDSLDPRCTAPNVKLASRSELETMGLDLVFRPTFEDGDLLALAVFSNELHERANRRDSPQEGEVQT